MGARHRAKRARKVDKWKKYQMGGSLPPAMVMYTSAGHTYAPISFQDAQKWAAKHMKRVA